jgi:hypothetical protein
VKLALRILHGTPPSLRASRLLLAALLAFAAPLFADGPEVPVVDWLEKARTALAKGDAEAVKHASKALKAQPDGAAENRQMALVMAWAGHYEDSARYLRRALALKPDALLNQEKLSTQMPPADLRARLNQLAPRAESAPELCFLTGALLLLDDDRPRALAFLVRAEELAGSDGQAAKLVNAEEQDRNELRGVTALRESEWDEAQRSFLFAALDSPTVAEHHAGLVVALAAGGDDAMALKFANGVYARYRFETLLPWLQALKAGAPVSDAAARLSKAEQAGLAQHRLAALLYFAAGWYRSAREAGVEALLFDKLDDFTHDLQSWLEQKGLRDDPVQTRAPDNPNETPEPEQPGTEPETPTLEAARKLIRRADYTGALKILDHFTTENAEPEVYQLLFVVLVGRAELADASAAFQAWFLKVTDAERTRLNALRELFGSRELFEAWRRQITVVRDADPNVGLPRLLNCYVEVTRGRYNTARDELVVAKIESPGNLTVLALDRLLQQAHFQSDVTPDGLPDDPTPNVLRGRADREFRAGNYEAAKTAYLQAMEADSTLPHLTAGLLRCYFALGDYDNAVRQLQLLFTEQGMKDKQPRDLSLLLEPGYDSQETFRKHLDALKAECDRRPLSSTPWLLYGVIQCTRNEFKAARDALQVWHDNDTSKQRDPILLKFYEYARKRA